VRIPFGRSWAGSGPARIPDKRARRPRRRGRRWGGIPIALISVGEGSQGRARPQCVAPSRGGTARTSRRNAQSSPGRKFHAIRRHVNGSIHKPPANPQRRRLHLQGHVKAGGRGWTSAMFDRTRRLSRAHHDQGRGQNLHGGVHGVPSRTLTVGRLELGVARLAPGSQRREQKQQLAVVERGEGSSSRQACCSPGVCTTSSSKGWTQGIHPDRSASSQPRVITSHAEV